MSSSSTIQAAFLCFILLQTAIFTSLSYDDFDPSEDEWESATATYIKEANGSIITGNLFTRLFHCISIILLLFLSHCCFRSVFENIE